MNFVCNECVERNQNHFIVYIIFLCKFVLFAVHDGEVLCRGVHDLQQNRSGVLFKFPRDAERYVSDVM